MVLIFKKGNNSLEDYSTSANMAIKRFAALAVGTCKSDGIVQVSLEFVSNILQSKAKKNYFLYGYRFEKLRFFYQVDFAEHLSLREALLDTVAT